MPMADKQYAGLPVQIRAVDPVRRIISFVASDETVDRYGTVISVAGWNLTNYRKNPMFLFGHNYREPWAVMGRGIKVEKNVNAGLLGIDVAFIGKDINPVAEMVFQMYAHKPPFLNAVSVGFIPLETQKVAEEEEDKDHKQSGPKRKPHTRYLKQELLEVSAVTVPANPNALVQAFDEWKEKGVDPVVLMAARSVLPSGDVEEREALNDRVRNWVCQNGLCYPADTSASAPDSADGTSPGALVDIRPTPDPHTTARTSLVTNIKFEFTDDEDDSGDDEARIWEETENEVRHRERDPKDFKPESFRRMTLKASVPRVYAIVGRLKGETKTTIQSLRFPKPAPDNWTMAKAKQWRADHFAKKALEDLEKLLSRFTLDAEQVAAWGNALDGLIEAMESGPERNSLIDLQEYITSLPFLEGRAGAVLNARNKADLRQAQELIQRVLDSASKPKDDDSEGEESLEGLGLAPGVVLSKEDDPVLEIVRDIQQQVTLIADVVQNLWEELVVQSAEYTDPDDDPKLPDDSSDDEDEGDGAPPESQDGLNRLDKVLADTQGIINAEHVGPELAGVLESVTASLAQVERTLHALKAQTR